MANPEDVLAYWLDDLSPSDWYRSDEALDQAIRDRFVNDWQEAVAGGRSHWLANPAGTLAYIILLDQFPRNMFRGSGRAFASDKAALAAAKCAIRKGWDLRIDEPARQFFYLPLMHSENLCDQDRCVRLMLTRMPRTGGANLLHARAHREVIRRFGRFPYRNEALGRANTAAESEFIEEGGYGAAIEAVKAAAAA